MGLPSRRTLLAITTVAAAVAVGAAFSEALIRFDVVGAPQLELDIYRWDDSGNLALRRSVSKRQSTKLWSVEVAINSAGNRGPEPALGDKRLAVLCLGDSFGFGWGVEFDEAFFSQLDQASSEGLRWVNASVPGTGPGDHLQRLPELLRQYRPATVVLLFFVGNDFSDADQPARARYDIVGGLLTLRGSEEGLGASAKRFLVRNSRLLQALRAIQLDLLSGGAGERNWDEYQRRFAAIHLANPPPSVVQDFDATQGSLDGIAQLCREADADLIVVAAPASFQVVEAELADMTNAMGVDSSVVDLDRPQRLLRTWAAEHQVAFVDTLPALRDAHAADPQLRLYHYPDAHWTAAGHRIAAKAVADTLDRVAPEPGGDQREQK